MKQVTQLLGLAIGLVFFSVSFAAKAGDVEEAIITKVIQVYGGEKLTSAKSITVVNYNKGPWPGQSENPGLQEIWRINEELTIDFVGKRKSMLSWRVSRSGKDLDRFVFDGQKGRIYDILNHKYSDEDWLSYDSLGRTVARSSDTLIARALADNKDSTNYLGEAVYRGTLHQKLRIKMATGPEYTLYIHKAKGLISKMVRQHPSAGELAYVFSNHGQSDGVVFARDMDFFVGGKPRKLSVERNISINPPLENLFDQPPGYTNWGEVFDSSEMSVRKLAKNVYHAGKGRSFTLFVDAGDYLIASGGERDLKETYQAVKAQTGDKPLKYMILTHHHTEHLGTLHDALALGANIVTVAQHLPPIRNRLSKAISNESFTLVEGKASFGDGAVQIHDIATAHSEHYLLVYLPKQKLVFGEDLFETQLKTGMPRVHQDMVTFRQALDALDIEVERFSDGHSLRQLTMAELRAATDAFREVTCPRGYHICAAG